MQQLHSMSPMNGATGRLICASQIHTQSIRNTTAKQTKNIFWVILSIKKLPQRDQSVTTSVGKLRMQARQSLIFPLSSSFGCHTHQADLEANLQHLKEKGKINVIKAITKSSRRTTEPHLPAGTSNS